MVGKGRVVQYKSGFKTIVKLPLKTIGIKFFPTLEKAKLDTERHCWTYCGGVAVEWDDRVELAGGMRGQAGSVPHGE